MADDGITVLRTGGIPATAFAAIAEAVRQDLVTRLAQAAVLTWDQEAREGLGARQLDYVKGIQAPEIAEGMATVVLVGALPNRIENGHAAYDLHDTLLSDKVPVVERGQHMKGKHKKKDGGFYRYIPFRHQGPGSEGVEGTPMGQPYSRQMDQKLGEDLGKLVYKMAKQLSASGEHGWGQSLPRKMMFKLKPHHSDSIYAGMYRVEKEYGQTVQNTYRTFRTISTGSPGWRVAAQPGKHFAQKVATHINGIAQETLDTILEEMQESA